MNKVELENALRYAAKGWKLFPCKWDNGHKPLIKWGEHSTSELSRIRQWAVKTEDVYFCVNLKASNLSIIDCDNKKGKAGSSEWFRLQLENGDLAPGLTVSTPSGDGRHHYIAGALPNSTDVLAKGIDTPVMAPVPGSTVPGKGRYKVIVDKDPSVTPPWISDLLGKSKTRNADSQVALCDLDEPDNVAEAVKFLIDAEPAIEGDGGDAHTYQVACQVRDYGISEGIAFNLMGLYWNEGCQPPWDLTELQTKVSNAYTYALQAPGSLSPAADFEPVPVSTEPQSEVTHNVGRFKTGADIIGSMKNPDWLIKKYIESDTVTLIYGESGAMKSFLSIDQALCICTGKQWAGKQVKRGSVFYLAGEGHGGIGRRLKAWCLHNDYNPKDLTSLYVSGTSVQLDKKKIVTKLADEIQEFIDHSGDPLQAIYIDTLATSFGGMDENSTKDMMTYLTNIGKCLRERFTCAVILVHHSGHSKKDRARGSSSLFAGVDAHFRVEKYDKDILHADDFSHICDVQLCRPGKMKDGIPPSDTGFQAIEIKVGTDEDLEDITSIAMTFNPEYKSPKAIKLENSRVGGNQEFILEYVKQEGGQCHRDDLIAAFKDWKTEKGETYSRQQVYKSLKSLSGKDKIVETPENIIVSTGFRGADAIRGGGVG